MGVAFPYAVGIIGAFENLWGAGNPLLDTSTFGYYFGVMFQGHSSPIIPSLDALRVYENHQSYGSSRGERLQRKGEVVKGAPSPAGSPNSDRPPSSLPRGWLQLWPRRWRWDAEARFPPLHSPREHKDHTATPPGPCLKDHGTWVTKSATISLPACPFHRPPHPGPTLRKTAPAQVRQVGPPERPALCLGTQLRTRQAMPGIGLSLSPTQAVPHPHHHTGSHLLWQTASFKLLTPVVLIQGVTGDPSLANKREEPISPSTHPSMHVCMHASILPAPRPQLTAPSSVPILIVTILSQEWEGR